MNDSMERYENNGDCDKSNESFLNATNTSSMHQHCAGNNTMSTIAINNSVVIPKGSNKNHKSRIHFNRLWSVWYGILVTLLQGYLIVQGMHKYLGCSLLTWKNGVPTTELNMQLIFCGLTLLFLPLFLASALFKVGNLANDGVKLSSRKGTCSSEPQNLFDDDTNSSTLKSLWTHGFPTSVFIHIITALCLLLPHLLLEAKLIQSGHLPKENVWMTEFNFLKRNDRMVVLSFMTTSPYQNDTNDYNASRNSNRLEDVIETIKADYDLDDFDTHESLESYGGTVQTTYPSSSIQISSITNEYVPPSTQSSTTIMSTTVLRATTTVPTPRTTKIVATASSGGSTKGRSHKSSRKHHKKHHHNYHEGEDVEDINANLELKPERNLDFDGFDREVHLIDATKATKKKNKSSSKSSEQLDKKAAKKSKESEIHILKPEVTPESYPSTTVTTDSKIIEIKSQYTNKTNLGEGTSKRIIKRAADLDSVPDSIENQDILLFDSEAPSIDEDKMLIKDRKDEIYSARLIGAVPNFTKVQELDGVPGIIQSVLGSEDMKFEAKDWFTGSPSLEFLNLALALLVFAVRYPSVFWDSSKSFAIIFSLQLIANGLDILLLFAGTSILFKLQVVGQFANSQQQLSPLLLNGIVTIALTLLAYVLVICSSMILYLYGHSRLADKIRDRLMITLKGGDVWSYFSHCASMCFILALSVVKAPILHDLCVTYKASLDGTIFVASVASVVHFFLWIIVWFCLTLKRRWSFKLPHLQIESIYQSRAEAVQPLLTHSSVNRQYNTQNSFNATRSPPGEEEVIYWPSSPKMKVTFNDVPSTLSDHNLVEHDKLNKRGLPSICSPSNPYSGPPDEGDYATLRTGELLQISEYDEVINLQRMHHEQDNYGRDDISEEGKLLECVRDESVTYASAKDLEPPLMISPLAPVTVTVHTSSEVHISTSTPRFIRRGDSGMPNEALTPKSDTTSTESSNTCSPPDHRASSESSGVHSGEDTKEDVVIRARPVIAGPQKSIMKQPQPAIIEEPFGRPTNMSLSSFKDGQNCSTLPSRGGQESQSDYSQCNTMPLPVGAHHNNQHHRISANEPRQRTTLPNNIRYSAGQYLRQIPHIKNAENPYGYGLTGSGHHTFSKHIQNEIVGPNANIISSSQSQQQFVPHPVAQPMHNFQTTSSSFTTFNHPPQSPSMYNNCNNPPSYNADHHHGSNNVVYSSTHNSLQMH